MAISGRISRPRRHLEGQGQRPFSQRRLPRLHQDGGCLTFCDLTIIAETPKITPHREAIRARIAEITGLAVSRVSVKATTSEGLGFTGRGEGIAVQAVCHGPVRHKGGIMQNILAAIATSALLA